MIQIVVGINSYVYPYRSKRSPHTPFMSARFHAMWSDSPDQHITSFARQLDRWQHNCAKLKKSMSETGKVDLFCKKHVRLRTFRAKFLEDWEVAMNHL